jgi:glycosyltransferase involved in cell wall biosynthesis
MRPTRRNAETLVAQGYEVDVICLKRKGQKSKEKIDGVGVYRLPIEHHRGGILRYLYEYFGFFNLAFWKLTWLSLRRRYQVIEVSGIPDFLVFTGLIPKLMGASVILNFLDHTADYFQEKYMLSSRHVAVRFLRWVEKTSACWADYVFITQNVTRDLLANRGVSAAKMSVIPNVPDEEFRNHCSSLNSDNGYFRLITHGTLLEIYGIQTLLRAVPLLIEEIPQLKVEILGDGEYRPELERITQSLGIQEYVDFTGLLPQEEVPGHITQSHIGIVAVKCKFPALSNKLFEYLAMEKPAVVTSISANKAHFSDNAVMFFEPDDERDLARCVLELFKNPEKRAALAASGSAAYQKYRWSAIKYDYLKVFDSLIKGKGIARSNEQGCSLST